MKGEQCGAWRIFGRLELSCMPSAWRKQRLLSPGLPPFIWRLDEKAPLWPDGSEPSGLQHDVGLSDAVAETSSNEEAVVFTPHPRSKPGTNQLAICKAGIKRLPFASGLANRCVPHSFSCSSPLFFASPSRAALVSRCWVRGPGDLDHLSALLKTKAPL